MGKKERIELIKSLEKERKSRIITYITGTRPNISTSMSMDTIRKIYEHLKEINIEEKKKPNIDLFLCSNGGDGTVPWRLVTLIREYSEKFSVIIPYRAFSAATLTALGADSIIMHPMGMLGPTDPTVSNDFNPIDPMDPRKKIGISVEDVTAYISLIKEDVGIQHEDELVQAFNHLADKVHPLALGNVKRSLSQSRMMAKKLLCLHMDNSTEQHKINDIVNNLTSKLYYHGHPINRNEAKEQVGIENIIKPTIEIEEAIWKLYLEYENEMLTEQPFDISMEFVSEFPGIMENENKITTLKTLKLVYIESTNHTDTFVLDYKISGSKLPNGIVNTLFIVTKQLWVNE